MDTPPSGQLSPSVEPDVIMMLCTAGHVDHGKTRLVKLLTGCSTDRLKEEQERGLTIELGFAPCFLGGDLCVGIVDVPGHERFIRNMVAGVSGIDMAILVIAADDGVMPQTIEHLQIMELLGVTRGLVALTKIDLVPPELVMRRSEEIRAFLAGTFLDGAPICPVSAETFDGLSALYDALVAEIKALQRRPRAGVFRMPVERVFSQPGFGSIVTGIPVAGQIAVGDQVAIQPGNVEARVRGLQCFLRETDRGGSGQCLALNLQAAGKVAFSRGQVLTRPGYLDPVRFLHARLKIIPGLERPLKNAESVRVHTGTVDAIGRVYLLEDKVADGATSTLVTIALDAPAASASGDRVILRRLSPAATIAGGVVLQTTAGARRPRRHAILDALRAGEAFFEGMEHDSLEEQRRRVEFALLALVTPARTASEISHATLLTSDATDRYLSQLQETNRIRRLAHGYFVHVDRFAEALDAARQRVTAAAENENALSLAPADINGALNLPAPLWDAVVQELTTQGVIRVEGGRLIICTREDDLCPKERELVRRIEQMYESTGYASPRPEQLPELLNASPSDIKRMLEYLYNEGRLVRVNANVVFSRPHFRTAQQRVIDTIQTEGHLDSGDFKRMIDSTRKYALAILDYLDGRGVTIRHQSLRKLTTGYEKRLLK